MRPNLFHGLLSLESQKRPFGWANKPAFDDGLGESLHLSDREELADVSEQGFDVLVLFCVESLDV